MTEHKDTVQNISDKLQKLRNYLESLRSIAVAFSGGVDSTFLLKVAQEVLGDRVIAVTAAPHSFPKRELAEAKTFCDEMGIRHFVCDFNELEIQGFCDNPPNRCYICKKELFGALIKKAEEQNIQTVADGSNMDDNGDYRPGMRAISELGVKSPLQEVGLYKEEIRKLSQEMGLPTWKKPSFACLASRFPYGELITEEKLAMVEQAEQWLFDQGFRQMRVRIHDKMARIEVLPEEFHKLTESAVREELVEKLKFYGFTYVSMDLEGYRTGSMNEILTSR